MLLKISETSPIQSQTPIYPSKSLKKGLTNSGNKAGEEIGRGKGCRKAEVAEWSKAVDLGSIPKGRGFKPHLLHFLNNLSLLHITYDQNCPPCS